MSFGEAIKSVFSKYATFSGRARRSEFWYFFLFNLLVSFVLNLIPHFTVVSGLWALAILIPSLAVMVRRLHDIGKSGWTYLYFLIPSLLFIGYWFYLIFQYISAGYNLDEESVAAIITSNSSASLITCILLLVSLIASIIFIVWMARDSEPGENKWGPNPKEVPSESNSGKNY
jgi:uncharacterized membrane protein YhaH (DUF805 family)